MQVEVCEGMSQNKGASWHNKNRRLPVRTSNPVRKSNAQIDEHLNS